MSSSESVFRIQATPAAALVGLACALSCAASACALVVVDRDPGSGEGGSPASTSASGGTGGAGGPGGTGGNEPVCPAAAPWSASFGDPYSTVVGQRTIRLDEACNVQLVTHKGTGTIDVDGAPLPGDPTDIMAVTFAPEGQHQGTRVFQTPAGISGNLGMDRDGNAVFVLPLELNIGNVDLGCGATSTSGGSLYVVKLDAAGGCLWSRKFNGGISSFPAHLIAADGDGNVYLGGRFFSKVDFGGVSLGSDPFGFFVVKLDAAGEVSWAKSFGHDYADWLESITVDPSGAVVLAGTFHDHIDFGGPPLDGAFSQNVFVAKLDASGQHVYSRGFHGLSPEALIGYPGARVATDALGNVFVGGGLSGPVDFGAGQIANAGSMDAFVVALDPSGTPQWSRTFGSADAAGWENLYTVAADGEGGVLIAGTLTSPVDFGGGLRSSVAHDAVFVAAFDSAGNHHFSQVYGGGEGDYAAALAIAPGGDGSLLLTGDYRGTLDFGSGLLTSEGNFDMFVTRIPMR